MTSDSIKVPDPRLGDVTESARESSNLASPQLSPPQPMPGPTRESDINFPRLSPVEARTLRSVQARYADPVAFGPFSIDLSTARVFRDGVEFPLRPQVFRVLQFLIQNPGRLIDYDEMLQGAWSGSRVSKHTVAVTVNELKAALGGYGAWISIRPGYGYSLEIPESERFMRTGQHFRNQLTKAGIYKAIDCFARVASLEGGNGRAWELLSGLYLDIAWFGIGPAREAQKSFEIAWQRALALQGLTPGLRQNRALGLLLFEGKLAEAEAEFRRVRDEFPAMVSVSVRLATVCFMQGRTDDAFDELRHAENTDPLYPSLPGIKARLLLFCRETEAAIASARDAIALHPGCVVSRIQYADILDFAEDPAALTEYRVASTIASDLPWIRAAEARCLARQGRCAEASEILNHLLAHRPAEFVDACHLAWLLDALGRRDDAFSELRRAVAEKSPLIPWLPVDTKADCLRSDARFAEFVPVPVFFAQRSVAI